MNKTGTKKSLFIITGVILLLIIFAALWAVQSGKQKNGQGETAVSVSDMNSQESSQEQDSSENFSETESISSESAAQEKTENDSENNAASGKSSNSNVNTGKTGNDQQNSSGKEDNNASQTGNITFPYTIPGYNLVIQKIYSYDGIFLEDGSDSNISDAAAIVLKNQGKKPVEYTSITLKQDGKTLTFEASAIPAGAVVVVQEKNKAIYQNKAYTDCSAEIAETNELEMSEDQVRVEETTEGALKVINLTSEEIPCVRIFYKYYDKEAGNFKGGITYIAKLTDLAAGTSMTITPSHYTAGSSKVMMVRTYDSAD